MTSLRYHPAELRRTLHRVVDAAIAADDALAAGDDDALRRAIEIIARHADTLRALVAAGQGRV